MLAVGPDAIRGLVARTVLPQVGKGEQAPTLLLPDLDGKTVDLGALRGRRTLLLFWAPSCGFCQTMLPDLKLWERDLAGDGTRLLVISTGSPEDNRSQGFRSPVLLDPSSSALHVFGAAGTPTAVMLDEQGRVASGVEVGAEAVLALAGAGRAAAR
jgi:peroxiredoxin